MKWILLLTLVLSSNVLASENEVVKKDFKCFVDTNVGKKVVFYRWNVKKVNQYMSRLPATKIPNNGKANRAYIKTVVECIKLDEQFKSAEAQRIDERTPK
jgi:hypothetical protein